MITILTVRPSTSLQQRPALVFSDFDDSLHQATDPDGLVESCEVLKAHAPLSLNGICTGRGPTMARALADKLKPFPMQFIATNNGQNLYLNPENKPTDEFIAGLKLGDPSTGWDAGWEQHVKALTHGWSVDAVRGMMVDQLRQDGFHAAPSLPPPRESFTCLEKTIQGQRVLVAVPPDQPGYQVRCPNGPITAVHEQFGQQLAEQIHRRLDAMGVEHQRGFFEEGGSQEKGIPHDRWTHYFQPVTVTKKTLMEYLATTVFPNVRYVVAIGDTGNDDHLEPQTVGQARVYTILAGDHHPDATRIAAHPRNLRAAAGRVAHALNEHLGHIRQQLTHEYASGAKSATS
ncbi:MAG: hypothetical protein ACYCW6_12110 [Candidatus Xenobia bacterium]